ncbi:MAG: hypothetical protein HN855_12275 [Anaerolineae bacterium]|jgi:Flp pilus assembly protein TadG|nr:hypothetical protein [Anaerolineae bacterium]MBT7071306.1 hypothetical protein [Anaerolineae bacterium]MBT7325930.1 hypothetical protein [Anaerolineae bacterium]
MDKNRKKTQTEQGQSLVELAISLIILLTLLAGAVDFGMALYSYVSLRDAAQEGALYASIDPLNATEITNRVTSSSSSPVDLANDLEETGEGVTIIIITTSGEIPVASATTSNACEGNGAAVRVEVSYLYHLIMPLLPEILGVSEIPLTASVTDAILSPPC